MTPPPLLLAQAPSPAPDSPGVLAGIWNRLVEGLTEMGNSAVDLVPKVVTALVILAIGYLVAKVIARLVRMFFAKSGLDDLIARSGVTDTLGKLGVTSAPGVLLAKLLFWVLVLGVVKLAADTMDIRDVSLIIQRVIAFLPRVLTASIILLVGFLVADFLQGAVEKTLESFGLDYAKTLAGILFGFIVILVLTVALSQLGIQTELLNATVKIVLAALALALGLALGLGLKGHAGNIVSGVYARDLYQVGTEIDHEGEPATVAGVGPLTTKLRKRDGSFVIVPNDHLISRPVTGKGNE